MKTNPTDTQHTGLVQAPFGVQTSQRSPERRDARSLAGRFVR